ncbi:hypothetical protein MAR_038099 [Mya arenaria]|uniref:Uncharacterized protein n=1 Tax=Mya arenaria TaxID=6604 RepID=A0ABY7FQD1_MYAAR|nr:hypothetical protein MAR_038099 [Mya arenaria]
MSIQNHPYMEIKQHEKDTMTSTLFVLFALAVAASATVEVNHIVQTDDAGHKIQMDIIRDEDAKLVLSIIGDVSRYRGSIQTVNFHDYNVGYGVLKDINRKICILTRPLVPMQPSWKYEQGTTDEVHFHNMHFNRTKMSNEEVLELAGSNIATFCHDYNTYYAEATPGDRRDMIGELGMEGRRQASKYL